MRASPTCSPVTTGSSRWSPETAPPGSRGRRSTPRCGSCGSRSPRGPSCTCLPAGWRRTRPPPRLDGGRGAQPAFLPTPIAELIFARGSGLPPRLRRLFVGGARLRRRPPAGTACEVIDCYGPAEATVIAVWGRVEPGGADLGPAPIGRPVDNLRAHVLDLRLQPVRRGCVGELCLAGAGLARGYLGRPDLTADALPSRSVRGRTGRRACTAPGDIARGACRKASSTAWAGSTTRSRCGGCASSWGRSRRRSPATRPCARPW